MQIACSSLACDMSTYPTIPDALARIRDLGFSTVDLALFENWQHVNPSALAADPALLSRTADDVLASGLSVCSFNAGLSGALGDPDPAAFDRIACEFAALLELAEAVSCPNITLQPPTMRDVVSVADQLEIARRQLGALAYMRGDRDITIGLEGHANTLIEKPGPAIELIESLWPAVGYTYDPSHPELQDVPLAETEPLLRYTCHAHVRNASTGKMQDTMAAGSVDFAWVIDALRRAEYGGAVSVEYFSNFDPDFTSVLALRDHLLDSGLS